MGIEVGRSGGVKFNLQVVGPDADLIPIPEHPLPDPDSVDPGSVSALVLDQKTVDGPPQNRMNPRNCFTGKHQITLPGTTDRCFGRSGHKSFARHAIAPEKEQVESRRRRVVGDPRAASHGDG